MATRMTVLGVAVGAPRPLGTDGLLVSCRAVLVPSADRDALPGPEVLLTAFTSDAPHLASGLPVRLTGDLSVEPDGDRWGVAMTVLEARPGTSQVLAPAVPA